MEKQDLLEFNNYYVRASTGKRFLNYLIDMIGFYMLIVLFGIFLALIFPAFIDQLNDDTSAFSLVDRIIFIGSYAAYMALVELLFKGKSLGKLITGTRAVKEDGSNLNTGKAFARGFSRAVPFCVFSAFGNPCNPWQDRWTDTMVIDERKSKIIQE